MPDAFYTASESTQICATKVFFFDYSLATSMTNLVQIFTGLLYYACWDTPIEMIHQLRILVFGQLPKVFSASLSQAEAEMYIFYTNLCVFLF